MSVLTSRNPRTAYERAQSELIDDLAIEIVKLRRALRGLALEKRVRLAKGGGEVPNGGSCRLCKSQWPNGWPENHEASCLLAVRR